MVLFLLLVVTNHMALAVVEHVFAYSTDGITWTASAGISGGMTTCKGICWNGTMFVAVGDGNSNVFGYSYDGINWFSSGSSNLTTGNCVAWNGTRFVAGGVTSDEMNAEIFLLIQLMV